MKPKRLEIVIFNTSSKTAERLWNVFVAFLETAGYIVSGMVSELPDEWYIPQVDFIDLPDDVTMLDEFDDLDNTVWEEQNQNYNDEVGKGVDRWKRV